jgi:mono/diheme cytochrome c family protein
MCINKSAGLVLAGLLLFALSGAFLQGQDHKVTGKKLTRAPITYTDAQNGEQMYKQYCAACHGPEGKGDGPAVHFLKTPPPDITTLKLRNHGKYPAGTVKCALLNSDVSHAQATLDMPDWGSLFWSQNQGLAPLMVYNLTSYVESLQRNPQSIPTAR